MKSKENKKVFISGKITGESIYYCTEKFEKAMWGLVCDGFDIIINPLAMDGIHFGISHEDAMKLCLDELETCTHIYMLKDWELSRGAKMEHDMAKVYGLEIIYETD